MWPPPSPPWAITASTPIVEHLLGVAAGADGRHDEHAGVVAPGDGVVGRRTGEAHEPHALADDERDALGEVGLIGAEVDAEGRSVRSRTSRTCWRSWSGVIVTAARIPKPPAALVAAVSRAPETQPIPVCTTGSSHPTSSQNRVRSATDLTRRQVTVRRSCPASREA